MPLPCPTRSVRRKQRLQVCVFTNAGSEGVAIGLAKRIDAGVASFITNLPVAITFGIVEAGAFIPSSVTLSGSFLWHGQLSL